MRVGQAVAAEANVDRARVYATGLSNGGYLSHRLACEAADVFAAVAPVAARIALVPTTLCQPSRPIAIIEFADDHAQSLVGGQMRGIAGVRDHLMAALEQASAQVKQTEARVAFDRAEAVLRRSRDPLVHLELFLLQRQRGQERKARTELSAFAKSMERDWPAPLVRVYLGEGKDADAMAAATDSDERCEAWYYLGRLHAPDDPTLARKQLQNVKAEECDRSDFAEEELQQLQSR